MEKLIGVLVVVVVVGAVVVWAVRREIKAARNLTALASRLGLRFRPAKENEPGAGNTVEGDFQGRPARFWTYATGSGKSRTEWVAVSVRLAGDSRLTVQLKPQGFGTKLAELFGAKEIEVGETRFDGEWFIRTNAPGTCRAALLPELRDRLMTARQTGSRGVFTLEKGVAAYTETGTFARETTVARLESLLPLLRDFAEAAETSETVLPVV
jgi:hypothetical protein